MAVTDTAHDSTVITRFFGLSTDTKPESAMIGATFYETDTKHGFVFDGEWRRGEQIVVEQAAAVVVEKIPTTDELLSEILTQLKIQNAHLSIVNGEVLDETDIPAEVR